MRNLYILTKFKIKEYMHAQKKINEIFTIMPYLKIFSRRPYDKKNT